MNDYLRLGIWVLVIGAAFAFAWRKGYLKRLADYVLETQQELKKCTWPSVAELKGSTVVVVVALAILSAFTVGMDLVTSWLVRQVL